MSSEVTSEEAQRQIGKLPSLGPHPNATNIRNLEVAFFDRLGGIPSQQSQEYGYKGMAQQCLEYALVFNVPWVPFPRKPSRHKCRIEHAVATQQRRPLCSTSYCMHVRRQRPASLYHGTEPGSPQGIQANKRYWTCQLQKKQSTRDILGGLRDTYGISTPDEVIANDASFAKRWDPNEPVENFFHNSRRLVSHNHQI